jgi:sensor c-di-GMP phosphodiesterase-like protein
MAHEHNDALIVRSTIALGHSMGIRIVAEGIEDAVTLEKLRALGCDFAQGYFLSKPLPEADLLLWAGEWAENERAATVEMAETAETAIVDREALYPTTNTAPLGSA